MCKTTVQQSSTIAQLSLAVIMSRSHLLPQLQSLTYAVSWTADPLCGHVTPVLYQLHWKAATGDAFQQTVDVIHVCALMKFYGGLQGVTTSTDDSIGRVAPHTLPRSMHPDFFWTLALYKSFTYLCTY